jgi:hypothetical protein
MNTDDPPEWFSLTPRAEPLLAVPPMNALPSAHQLVEQAIPHPIDRPDCPARHGLSCRTKPP